MQIKCPEKEPPQRLVDYFIFNEDKQQWECGLMQRDGEWISYISLNPIVTKYMEQPE